MIIDDEIINMAIEVYGLCMVEEVKRMVERTSIDDMLTLYADRKMYVHLDCLEFLYLR